MQLFVNRFQLFCGYIFMIKIVTNKNRGDNLVTEVYALVVQYIPCKDIKRNIFVKLVLTKHK